MKCSTAVNMYETCQTHDQSNDFTNNLNKVKSSQFHVNKETF